MKTLAAVVLLGYLLVIKVEGQARAPRSRCLCADKGVNMVSPKLIEKVDIIPPTPSCGNLEIVVTLKNGAEPKCLSPDSKFTQKYLMKALEKRTLQK
ncbi:C-X-C motif chemokine 11-6-like [Danio rerio]|uniref:C-X-C motif chemokine 11-6-like n=1 Tax=Danio rerio TaxID=7955 RepID=A0A0G2KM47_DANRE|nr:C-X-C motif chemokine 11-6-like [Danio rerio]|eukprot:XP_696046.1 C-X-C motif chemokine 11-6-like [Danio rerio]